VPRVLPRPVFLPNSRRANVTFRTQFNFGLLLPHSLTHSLLTHALTTHSSQLRLVGVMYLSRWEDVKVYPRAAEGAVLLLVVLSLAHALREVRVSERVSGGVVRGRWRWRALSVWLSLLLVAGSWELYSALLLPKWHPVCYPKSLIMLSNCHSLWGSLRHVPREYSISLWCGALHASMHALAYSVFLCIILLAVAYMSWAVGRHEKYTAAPLSFVACFLFLFYSLSFECFALSNNLLRYSKLVLRMPIYIFCLTRQF
jgi:hypothetical protein